MMNGPYYRNNSRSVPVQQPKVVSIPVHFVSSDKPQTNKHSSALKIQKVFRGHTVRKSVKKIVSIKNEVNEIENRLQNDAEFVDQLRNDAKERLRVNETLMSLLFKLDSVRGVGNGVRELRKSVAKKAVALQEKVDSIAQSSEEDHDDVINDEKTEFCDGDDVSNSIGNEVNGEDVKEVVDDDVTKNDQNSESVEDGVIDDVSNENRDQEELVVNEGMDEDSMKGCDDDVSSNVRNLESVENEHQDVKEGVEKKCDDDDVSKSCCDHETVVNEDRAADEGVTKECGGDDVSRRCCEKGMVEKLMCDNAKMMKLMIQISERNEMQTRMINSLSKRVEQLEKAFMSDKSRRRKKCTVNMGKGTSSGPGRNVATRHQRHHGPRIGFPSTKVLATAHHDQGATRLTHANNIKGSMMIRAGYLSWTCFYIVQSNTCRVDFANGIMYMNTFDTG
ncbi:hypothetical protein CTI12_AA263480 [Artemisia annua]|uniref:BAG domain-containing protein n=1 Tax=Artemisia annua TaxID=35608 RepID=A0A2U1NID6_ARTAN|nr:hypothetical protein CTI12_AA263480 [Artemisia annua]